MNEGQLKDLIERVLNKLGLYSPEASDLVFKTLKVESLLQYIRQVTGIACGFCQMEPRVAVYFCDNYQKYRKDLMKQVADTINVKRSIFTLPKEGDWAGI